MLYTSGGIVWEGREEGRGERKGQGRGGVRNVQTSDSTLRGFRIVESYLDCCHDYHQSYYPLSGADPAGYDNRGLSVKGTCTCALAPCVPSGAWFGPSPSPRETVYAFAK